MISPKLSGATSVLLAATGLRRMWRKVVSCICCAFSCAVAPGNSDHIVFEAMTLRLMRLPQPSSMRLCASRHMIRGTAGSRWNWPFILKSSIKKSLMAVSWYAQPRFSRPMVSFSCT